jgi:phosphatidylserine/phosphatidylglycerophosphate/cardiolipin synthase-like enzyme
MCKNKTSIQKGPVAHDGHLFANDQWEFIESVQSTFFGNLIEKLPDNIRLIVRTRVAVSEFPKGQTTEFPPVYQRTVTTSLRNNHEDDENHGHKKNQVPMLTMGRYGAIDKKDRPADDAFIAMFGAAKKSIRLSLQDLGPVCLPGTKIPLPGCVWPKEYLNALGQAIWERGVDVEIVLSNPGSIPGGLSATEANYGNGWSCVDVSAELIKCIKNLHSDATDEDLAAKVRDNLRVCFLRRSTHHRGKWDTGMTLGLHAKHFIIDNRCAYIGSQNLYICDLAEWGVVIDDGDTVKQIMDEYWNPMWEASYTGDDVDPNEVINNLDLDRDGKEASNEFEKLSYMQKAAMQQIGMGNSTDENAKHYHHGNADIYCNEDDD